MSNTHKIRRQELSEAELKRRSARWDKIAIVALLVGSGLSAVGCVAFLVALFVNVNLLPTLAVTMLLPFWVGLAVFFVALVTGHDYARQVS